MARSLDRRFEDDLTYLLDRDGPRAVARILIHETERIGFRGAFEEAVGRHVRARHPGRPVELVVVGGDRR